jgi:hypothetical protein
MEISGLMRKDRISSEQRRAWGQQGGRTKARNAGAPHPHPLFPQCSGCPDPPRAISAGCKLHGVDALRQAKGMPVICGRMEITVTREIAQRMFAHLADATGKRRTVDLVIAGERFDAFPIALTEYSVGHADAVLLQLWMGK